MPAWSPTLEGFRIIVRRPALPFAEVMWRWSFGAAACVLLGFGLIEYLDTLPVSTLDLLLLRSRQPALVSQAMARIFGGSGLRAVLAFIVVCAALAILWIVLASVGRAATLIPMLANIRSRARHQQVAEDAQSAPSPIDSDSDGSGRIGLRSLAGLHFLRAGVALAAGASCVAAFVMAGFVSSQEHPHPGLVFLLACAILLLVWLAWTSLTWLLSLASIFVIRQHEDTFTALISAVGLCRDRPGSVAAVETWFGMAHLVLFVVATSAVGFLLSLAGLLPTAVVLATVLTLTLVYFAMIDMLRVGRLAGYVAILEAPPAPLVASAPMLASLSLGNAAGSQHSALSIPPETVMVDQEELILSDRPTSDDPDDSPLNPDQPKPAEA
jgi:hypothetical protein